MSPILRVSLLAGGFTAALAVASDTTAATLTKNLRFPAADACQLAS